MAEDRDQKRDPQDLEERIFRRLKQELPHDIEAIVERVEQDIWARVSKRIFGLIMAGVVGYVILVGGVFWWARGVTTMAEIAIAELQSRRPYLQRFDALEAVVRSDRVNIQSALDDIREALHRLEDRQFGEVNPGRRQRRPMTP